jgi:hypothetical protein
MAYRIRLDPWAPEYDPSIQLPDDEPDAEVDLMVERVSWGPLRPEAGRAPQTAVLVDGVRRVEHRLLVEDEGRAVYGLLGSFGVGAVVAGSRAHIVDERIERVACTGGGLRLQAFDAGAALLFRPETVPENTPVAPLQALQRSMRRAEAALAGSLAARAELVFLDGPLTYFAGASGPVVGFVKRMQRRYLPPGPDALLPRLAVGERTPLFLIRREHEPRYSWYERIGRGRAIDAALAGVVRLEAAAALGLDRCRRLADAAALLLPSLASSPERDPRAPQNLYPIGALEARLRHLLGDPFLIRRAIEATLQEAVA